MKKFDSFAELLEQHQQIILAKKEQDRALTKNKETKVQNYNIKFVEAFDNFSSFPKAAGFIQDWVKTRKENSHDLCNDFPALVERGKNIRAILMHLRTDVTTGKPKFITNSEGFPLHPEVANVHALILTQNLHGSEDDYVFYFTINLLEQCCSQPKVPLIAIRNIWLHLKNLIDDDKLKLTEKQIAYAHGKIENIRVGILFEFVKHLRIENIAPDYFENLANFHLQKALYPDASILILDFGLFSKFDLIDLIINLAKMKEMQLVKKILSH